MLEFKGRNGPVLSLDETSVFDIGSCLVDGVDLAPGRAIPDDGDPRIDHSLQGFLFTCGPDHIRHKEPLDGDASGKMYPLHGSFSSSPARLVELSMQDGSRSAVAEVDVTMANGGTARLTRRYSVDHDSGWIDLTDTLENTGTDSFPPMLMYHMNIGAKHFDDSVRLSGAMLDGGGFPWRFGDKENTVFCVPARASAVEGWAELKVGPIAAIGGKVLKVRFQVKTLPFLQMWRNQVAPAHVLGIEPASHDWKSRADLAAAGKMKLLKPGESKTYAVSFGFFEGD